MTSTKQNYMKNFHKELRSHNKTERFELLMTSKEKTELHKASKNSGLSAAAIVRTALKKHLK